MKDFSEWLDDLTGELQEPDEAPKINIIGEDAENYYVEVYQGSGDLWAEDLAKRLYGQQVEEVDSSPEERPWAGASPYCISDDPMAGDEEVKAMTATEVDRRWQAKAVKAHELMIESVKRLDEYRRNPYQWMESDENE